ncbi:MAG: hypothetical protein VXY26_01300 [Bacteroidota bacterium]|nr:hypothetical protein [Bacteroidota bacterium]
MNIVLLFTIFFNSFLIAQNPSDLGKITLHIVMPTDQSTNFANLKSKELNKVRSKITSITSRNGIAGSGKGNFVIYPTINIYDEEKMSTGMDNLVIVRAEFSLVIKEINNGQIYGSCSVELEGTGRDRNRALSKCIQSINTRDSEFKNMIEGAKAKIINYYESRCNDIQEEARSHSKRRDYLSAISTLMQVPNEVSSCYNQISAKSIEYYNYYIEIECQENLSKAKVAKAKNNWDEAAEYIIGILPHYDCYFEAMSMLKEIEDHRCSVNLGKAEGAWSKGEKGADEAAMYLAMIPSDSECSKRATEISNEIRNRLSDLEKRNWDLEYEKYNRETLIIENALKHAQNMEEKSIDYQHTENMKDKQLKEQKENNIHSENMKSKEVELENMKQIRKLVSSVWESKAEIAKSKSKEKDEYNYYTNFNYSE